MARIKIQNGQLFSEIDVLNGIQDAFKLDLLDLLNSMAYSYGVVLRTTVDGAMSDDLKVTTSGANVYVAAGNAIWKISENTDRGTEDRVVIIKNTAQYTLDASVLADGTYYVQMGYAADMELPAVRSGRDVPNYDVTNVMELASPSFSLNSTEDNTLVTLASIVVSSGSVSSSTDLRYQNIFNIKSAVVGRDGVLAKPTIFGVTSSIYDIPSTRMLYYGDYIANLSVASSNTLTISQTNSELIGAGFGSAITADVFKGYTLIRVSDGSVYNVTSNTVYAGSSYTITVDGTINATSENFYLTIPASAIMIECSDQGVQRYPVVDKQYAIDFHVIPGQKDIQIAMIGHNGYSMSELSSTFSINIESTSAPQKPFSPRISLADVNPQDSSIEPLNMSQFSFSRSVKVEWNDGSSTATVNGTTVTFNTDLTSYPSNIRDYYMYLKNSDSVWTYYKISSASISSGVATITLLTDTGYTSDTIIPAYICGTDSFNQKVEVHLIDIDGDDQSNYDKYQILTSANRIPNDYNLFGNSHIFANVTIGSVVKASLTAWNGTYPSDRVYTDSITVTSTDHPTPDITLLSVSDGCAIKINNFSTITSSQTFRFFEFQASWHRGEYQEGRFLSQSQTIRVPQVGTADVADITVRGVYYDGYSNWSSTKTFNYVPGINTNDLVNYLEKPGGNLPSTQEQKSGLVVSVKSVSIGKGASYTETFDTNMPMISIFKDSNATSTGSLDDLSLKVGSGVFTLTNNGSGTLNIILLER